MNLLNKKCKSCHDKNIKPFSKEEASEFLLHVPGWIMDDEAKKISRDYMFKDFVKAIEFVSQVADIAEVEGHHPDIFVSYNKVRLDLWTHAIDGLSENDFIVAAKIDDMLSLFGSNILS